MKIALFSLLFCISGMAFAQEAATDTSQPNTRFDGTWAVTLVAPDHADEHGTALGFTYNFTAQVKDGVLHGEHGEKGKPTWLEIDGKIAADGTALLVADGITGVAAYSLANVARGTRFTYQVKARFDGSKGTGSRVEGRVVNYTFVKQ